MPTTTLIVPTRDRSLTLADTLDSVLHHALQPTEIIVVDNGSSDETPEVVERAARGSSVPLRRIYEARSGSNIARDAGARAARGQLLLFLDDDVTLADGWLRGLLEAFATSAWVHIVAGRVELQYEAEKPRWLSTRLEGYLSSTARFGETCRPLRDDEYPVGANMAVLREAWVRCGGFGHLLGRDSTSLISNAEFELTHKVRQAGGQVLFAPASCVYHRIPAIRTSLRYFLRRCYWQGRSDARWQALTSTGTIPSSARLLAALVLGAGKGLAGIARAAAHGSETGIADEVCEFANRFGYSLEHLAGGRS
jgi:glycosyltransferase involved in cell wall biosynthesis